MLSADVLWLLRLVSLRRLRARPGEALRAVVAVMIGVGGLVAVHAIDRAFLHSFEASVDAGAGRTDLEVHGGETGLAEDALETVRAVAGVETAVPFLQSPAYVVGSAGEVLTVLGVDVTLEGAVRRYAARDAAAEVVDDPLVFLSQPDSIILTREFARERGLGLDDGIELLTSEGKRRFVIRGLLDPEGPAVAFGGRLAVMDYQAAQVAFAKQGRLDAVHVLAAPGTDVDRLAARLRAALGSAFEVKRPAARAAQRAAAIGSVQVLTWLLSSLALIVGMFFLYNGVAMTVAQRGREIALMRAVGVRAGDCVRLFLVEAGAIGLVGAVLGVALGIGMAALLLGPLAGSVASAVSLDVGSVEPAGVGPAAIALALGLGVLAALGAAWIPARQAARFAPATAARPGAVIALRETHLPSPLWGLAAVLLGGGLGVAAARARSVALGAGADAALVVGFALLASTAVRLVTPALARLLGRFGPAGRLAALNVGTNVQRSALTAVPLMLAVAIVVTVTTVVQSFHGSVVDWIRVLAPLDLQIASADQELGRNVPLPAALADEVATVPGIRTVKRFRLMHTLYEGRRIAIDANEYDPADPERCCVRFRRGDPSTAFPRLAHGEAVLVSENFADKFHVAPGDVVTLPTTAGTRALPVAAVVVNYNSDQGTIMMARRLFVALFGDDRVDQLLVQVEPGADRRAVAAAIAARFGERHQLTIFTMADLRRDILRRIDRGFLPAVALFLALVVIGCLGIANALSVVVAERVREIGVLRSLGMQRRDVVRLVVAESSVLGLMGAALGVGLGALLSYLWVAVHVRHGLGWVIDYHFAPWAALLGVLVALLSAPLAGARPARRAAATPPLAALAEE